MTDPEETKLIEVRTDDDSEREYRTIEYQERDDGWYMDAGSGFKRFASIQARNKDVRQLLRKEYDSRY